MRVGFLCFYKIFSCSIKSEFAGVIFAPLEIAVEDYYCRNGIDDSFAFFAAGIGFVKEACCGNGCLAFVPHSYGNGDFFGKFLGKLAAKFRTGTFGAVHIERKTDDDCLRFVFDSGGGGFFNSMLKALFVDDGYG